MIAPSFGEIFEASALRNGLMAVRIPDEDVEALLELGPDQHLTIDIIGERGIAPHGEIEFHLDPFRKHCLVNGLDEIAVTGGLEAEIAAYEERARRERPWEQQA